LTLFLDPFFPLSLPVLPPFPNFKSSTVSVRVFTLGHLWEMLGLPEQNTPRP
jgi:hypothetical protein